MRLALRLVLYATLAVVLAMVVVIGDLIFDKRRLMYAALGRDALVAACQPELVRQLAVDGFQPSDIALGDTPDITFSTLTGKTLTDTFTFGDGALQSRVDGVVVCGVKAGAVSVTVRTRSAPMRAT